MNDLKRKFIHFTSISPMASDQLIKIFNIKIIIFTLICFPGLFPTPTFAQYTLPFGFQKTFETPVYNIQNQQIEKPWAGGLNACQLGEIDLDFDGINDLVIFDRNGNRVLTYRNSGISGQMSYQFAPELALKLPELDDWAIFADYDVDGRNDIFAYSKGFAGIKVYKNTGNPQEPFELVVYPFLTSYQGLGYVNILVTYADYPAIVDLDGDGDLDLLTFWGLGSFVEYHQNESMENYGVPDSLVFRKTETCWGRFAEGDESNTIYLDTCFGETERPLAGKGNEWKGGDPKHTGSTFLVLDANGDGLNDLLLGDVDYESPAFLVNGGTPDEALMVSQSFGFPEYDIPIDLVSFPVMNYLDLNNDGDKDLIVSTFDPSLVKSENLNNIWFYQNNGNTNSPVFELKTKALFQDEMLDFGAGAYPVLFDHNLDGLMDLVVGNFGYLDSAFYGTGGDLFCNYRAQLALLENTGSLSNPQFKLITKNYADLPSYFPQDDPLFAATPTFGDLDGDGDQDMLLGNAGGNILAFRNIATTGQPADFVMMDTQYQNIDAGNFSVPQLFDLDADGLQDMIVGQRNGTISFYQNSGSLANPVFTLVNDSLGKVDVRDPNLSVYGYCHPFFFRDENQKIHLFAGSEFGEIFYYTEIENNLDGAFKLVMKNYLWIDEGLQTAVAIGNLNADNYPDMIVGNYSGGLGFFKGNSPPPAGFGELNENHEDITISPNPVKSIFLIKLDKTYLTGLTSLRIFDITGRVVFEEKIFSESEKSINISNLENGIYLLQILTNSPGFRSQSKTFKIIKQK